MFINVLGTMLERIYLTSNCLYLKIYLKNPTKLCSTIVYL